VGGIPRIAARPLRSPENANRCAIVRTFRNFDDCPPAIPMRAAFVDVNRALAEIASRLHGAQHTPGLEIALGRPDITPDELPAALAGAEIAVIDHTNLPEAIARRCTGLRHVVFLGTGARSYMNPEALAALGIEVHTIRGYGDTAVAECAMGLLWAAARGYGAMDRAMRAGQWLRSEGVQLTGKTLGLVGFGGIGAEMARLALGIGMKVVAWNRQPKAFPGVRFVALGTLLRDSDAVSMHLLLCDETRGFLSRERIAAMRPGAILVNTARGGVVDEAALASALASGHLGGAALDVFEDEPLAAESALAQCPNLVLTPHIAGVTLESNVRVSMLVAEKVAAALGKRGCRRG